MIIYYISYIIKYHSGFFVTNKKEEKANHFSNPIHTCKFFNSSSITISHLSPPQKTLPHLYKMPTERGIFSCFYCPIKLSIHHDRTPRQPLSKSSSTEIPGEAVVSGQPQGHLETMVMPPVEAEAMSGPGPRVEMDATAA